MSEAQRTWVTERLQNSAAAYRVLGNQTIFSPLDLGVLPTKRVKDHGLNGKHPFSPTFVSTWNMIPGYYPLELSISSRRLVVASVG